MADKLTATSTAMPDPDILSTPAAGPAAIRGAIIRAAGYGAAVAMSVVGAAILTRYLGPADFGRYTAVVSLVTIVGALAEAGMTSIGVREISVMPRAQRDRFVRGLLAIRLVATTLGVAVAAGFAALAGYDGAMVLGTLIVGLGLLLIAIQNTWAIPLQSDLRLGWVTALDLVRQAALVLAIAVLVVVGASLVPFYVTAVVSALAVLIATVPLVRGSVALRPSFRDAEWRRLLGLTVPFAAANAVGAVYVYLAVVLLSIVSTEAQTGYFGASFRVFIVLTAVPGLLVASAFPILARAAREDARRLAYGLERLFEMLLVLGAGVTLLTALGAEVAIDIVGGEEFESAVGVLRIQSLALLASYLLATWGFGLLSLSLYRGLLLANAAALVVSVAFTLTLGHEYGAEGAAFATVAGETTLAVGYAIALLGARPDLRPSLRVVPRVVVALAAAAATLLVPGLPTVVRLVIAGIVYAGAAWLLRAVPAEVGEAIRSRRDQ
jgi:O-antigen/teichoic acid export membrane protein